MLRIKGFSGFSNQILLFHVHFGLSKNIAMAPYWYFIKRLVKLNNHNKI